MRQSWWASHSFHVLLLSGSHLFGVCLEEHRKYELHWETTSGTFPYSWRMLGSTVNARSCVSLWMCGFCTFYFVKIDLRSEVDFACRSHLDIWTEFHSFLVSGFHASVHGGKISSILFVKVSSCGPRPCGHAATSGGASDQLIGGLLAV